MKDLNELFAELEKNHSSQTEMGSDVRDADMISTQELLKVLDQVFYSAKLLITSGKVITEDGLDRSERMSLFITNGLRNKKLQDAIAQILIDVGKEGITELVEDFKARKEELETKIVEGEIEGEKTGEFKTYYPEDPYGRELPQDATPRDEAIKKRWDRGGSRLTKRPK